MGSLGQGLSPLCPQHLWQSKGSVILLLLGYQILQSLDQQS